MRMPGVTSTKPVPVARRSCGASSAEHTTPSMPLAAARRARRAAFSAAEPVNPTRARSASARLVSTVTAISSGRCAPASTASRAARIIASPPLACTFSIQRPRRAADRHAPATVLGMSWNLRSRNTSKPRACSFSTTAGPAATKSSLPTFTRHAPGSSRAASASAASASAASSATITRLLSKLHPRQVAPRRVELGGAPRRERLPAAARRTLPEELPRLETAARAQVDGERLRVRVHQVLHELQVLAALGRGAQQLRVDQVVEADQRRIAAHFVADQAPRRLVAFVLGGGLVDDIEQIQPRVAVLQAAQEEEPLAQAAQSLVALEHALGDEPEVGRVLRLDRLPCLERVLVAGVAREPLAAQQVRAHALAVGLQRLGEARLRRVVARVHALGDGELAQVVGDLLLVVALRAHLEAARRRHRLRPILLLDVDVEQPAVHLRGGVHLGHLRQHLLRMLEQARLEVVLRELEGGLAPALLGQVLALHQVLVHADRAVDLAAAAEEAAERELQLDRLRVLLGHLQERLDRLVGLLVQQEIEAPEVRRRQRA